MTQKYVITAAGRSKRYRDRKAGKEVGPSPRAQHAAWMRAWAKGCGLSVRTLRRIQRQKELEKLGITGIPYRKL